MLTHNRLAPKTLTRASLFGIECRLAKVYGCSPLASKLWIAYARAVGRRSSMLEATLARVVAEGRRPLDNLHSEPCSASWYQRQKLTYGEKVVRESAAREERGERPLMRTRQAG